MSHPEQADFKTPHAIQRKVYKQNPLLLPPSLSCVGSFRSSSRGWRGLLQKAEEIGTVTGLGIGSLTDIGDLPRWLTQLLTHLHNLAKLLFGATAPLPDSVWSYSVWSCPIRPISSRRGLPLANFGEKQPIGLNNTLEKKKKKKGKGGLILLGSAMPRIKSSFYLNNEEYPHS